MNGWDGHFYLIRKICDILDGGIKYVNIITLFWFYLCVLTFKICKNVVVDIDKHFPEVNKLSRNI